MNNSAVLSNWSIDAFDCLSSKLYKKLSVELVSRVETFISSVILFDEVVLSENYKKNRIVKELNRRHSGTIRFIDKEELFHSTDMTDHISIDADLHALAFEELSKENKIWQIQHDPGIGLDIIKSAETDQTSKELLESNFLTQLRMWHWCYTNEMAELTDSVNMLPLSLNSVSEFALQKKDKRDAVLKNYFDYATQHNQRFVRLSESISTPFISEIKYIPPFMSLLLSRCKSSEDMVGKLADMREEFKEFRTLRHKFTNKVQISKNIGEQEEIVADWNRAWEALTAGEFKKPNLLRRKITSTDISSSLVSVETGGLKTFIKQAIDYHQYKKAHKQFQVFSNLGEHINNINQNQVLLGKAFGVESIVPIGF
ncbi:hypothetical protein Q4530_02775 [Colwellia sp. 1_MG-2023]|uniref:hypothetical protein n=1 Tax=unclassified Colwellia TaxID=196834 RepID=UPI001C084E72|nr:MULTISPECIES: hypothetical protein [unclassified Colwellia]MBU2923196.1 hypothetical protein [Colwellia sp. C2M11]MDO6651374.1 hypothetical protein [Colwellia sp. 3_MG-2023]MDO6664203.1 hypothetical protein [Colwellia sp. 2_MG-2023]MDO6688683.1 hypothetical protein [Colwellia sp. 1_MG-2023]